MTGDEWQVTSAAEAKAPARQQAARQAVRKARAKGNFADAEIGAPGEGEVLVHGRTV
ncbi:MAG: hypothetical protein ACRD59_15000 [Candidatus Acidiferrales bacterium]